MGVTALGRGAFRQIWDEPKIHARVRGSALAAVLAPGHLVMPGRCVWAVDGECGLGTGIWAGDGVGGPSADRLLPHAFIFVGKQVCFVFVSSSRFSNSSGKTSLGARRGVTSPTACAALIKWLRSRGFDLFLKRAQRCLLPPSHWQRSRARRLLGWRDGALLGARQRRPEPRACAAAVPTAVAVPGLPVPIPAPRGREMLRGAGQGSLRCCVRERSSLRGFYSSKR